MRTAEPGGVRQKVLKSCAMSTEPRSQRFQSDTSSYGRRCGSEVAVTPKASPWLPRRLIVSVPCRSSATAARCAKRLPRGSLPRTRRLRRWGSSRGLGRWTSFWGSHGAWSTCMPSAFATVTSIPITSSSRYAKRHHGRMLKELLALHIAPWCAHHFVELSPCEACMQVGAMSSWRRARCQLRHAPTPRALVQFNPKVYDSVRAAFARGRPSRREASGTGRSAHHRHRPRHHQQLRLVGP